MTNLTPIINLAIALIGAIVSAFVIPLIRKKMSKEDTDKLMALIRIAVMAAQQLYWDAEGPVRKQYVLDFLAAQGYDIDDEAILNAIEAEVLALHQKLVGEEDE